MTNQTRTVDLSVDPLGLGLIIDNLIVSISEKIQKGEPSIAEKNLLLQLFLADLRSRQAAALQQQEETQSKAEDNTEEEKEVEE